MTHRIDGPGGKGPTQATSSGAEAQGTTTKRVKTKFGKFMDRVAGGAMSAVSLVAPSMPGGRLVEAAAGGLGQLRDKTPDGLLSGQTSDSLQQMQQMQESNQMYNLQYFELQQQAQQDNRQFKAMSNLMKVRHDTAKTAINNMRA
jgi:hypothetical protein